MTGGNLNIHALIGTFRRHSSLLFVVDGEERGLSSLVLSLTIVSELDLTLPESVGDLTEAVSGLFGDMLHAETKHCEFDAQGIVVIGCEADGRELFLSHIIIWYR
jgi:hypothetical protein